MRKNSKEDTKEQEIPYSYLIDNIKILLIFLVVFNHIIAFQLVKEDEVVRFIWYGSRRSRTGVMTTDWNFYRH